MNPRADRRSPASSPGFVSTLSPPSDDNAALHPPRPSRLWLWFVAAFALQLAVWTAWFVIAARHPVGEVPLATPAAR